jgi:predicted nucleotidyltransferase component of viral defense system
MKPYKKALSRPANLDALAEECLRAIGRRGLGKAISIGGALGLIHYLDYRTTHDVDAWWDDSVSEAEKHLVIETVRTVLENKGAVKIRSWGDVVSIEMESKGRVTFSFQIAGRTVRLKETRKAAWDDLAVDSLEDLVASKMTALIERGAPRDFRDIYMVCQAGLVTVNDCRALWTKRQLLAGSDADQKRAKLAVQAHLKRIALLRPLAQIKDLKERRAAELLRHWFNGEFLDAFK